VTGTGPYWNRGGEEKAVVDNSRNLVAFKDLSAGGGDFVTSKMS